MTDDVCDVCGHPFDGRFHFHGNTFEPGAIEGIVIRANALGGEYQPRLQPTQYVLLHHAEILARQFEAAGLSEAAITDLIIENCVMRELWFSWGDINVCVEHDGVVSGQAGEADDDWGQWRVGDPLPDALVAAIKATVV